MSVFEMHDHWIEIVRGKQAAYERAIGAPLGEVIGCGHWGCIFESTDGRVVKITLDEQEGPMWASIGVLFKRERKAVVSVPEIHDIVRLAPSLPLKRGGYARPWAIVRDRVMPLMNPEDTNRPSDFTLDLTGDMKLDLTWRPKPSTTELGTVLQEFTNLQHEYRRKLDNLEWNEWYHRGKPLFGPSVAKAEDLLFDTIAKLEDNPVGFEVGELYRVMVDAGIRFKDNDPSNFGWLDRRGKWRLVLVDPGYTMTTVTPSEPREEWIENGRRS